MKVNLMFSSLFLFVSITTCNVFAFSIPGGGSEASHKETEKMSMMTITHSIKPQPSQAILFKMREDTPLSNLTEDITPTYPAKANYLIHPL